MTKAELLKAFFQHCIASGGIKIYVSAETTLDKEVSKFLAMVSPDHLSICADCEGGFTPRKQTQKYCSAKCRFRAWSKDNPRVTYKDDDGKVRIKRKESGLNLV
jgi:hypothetical protein